MSAQVRAKALKDELLETAQQDTDTIDFEIIEQFFFAYRDFVSDPDAILAHSGFGRAHHRVVHFVNREPGMTRKQIYELMGERLSIDAGSAEKYFKQARAKLMKHGHRLPQGL